MTIKESRAELYGLLASIAHDGLTVTDHVPASLAAPAFYIEPGSPLVAVAENPTYASPYQITWTITAVAEVGDNDKTTADLDELIDQATTAVKAAFDVTGIGQPYLYQTNTALHLAADITVTDTFNI